MMLAKQQSLKLLSEAALVKAVKQRLVRIAVLKDERAFNGLYERLQQAMTRSWNEQMRDGIAASLDRLRDLGPGKFTRADGKSIMSALEAYVGAEAIRAAMTKPVLNFSDALFRLGTKEVTDAIGIDLAFARADLDALDVLKQGNLYWVGESWNTHTQKTLDAALKDYFSFDGRPTDAAHPGLHEGGMTREQLMRRLADDFASITQRSTKYWELLADHTATKTREIGRVSGYERAGVKYIQVRAHIDDRTTEICRHMNGRVIAVTQLRQQRDNYLDALSRRDAITAKETWRMHNSDGSVNGVSTSKLPSDTASPPYHFRCRTITVAYFKTKETPVDGWKRHTLDREPLSKKDTEALIARAKDATWPHLKVLRGHFRKHGGHLELETALDYGQSAVEMIRRADRDVYTSIRKGKLQAEFVRKSGTGYVLTTVDLEGNKITSHHWRENLKSRNDEVPKQKQAGRGIKKWLFGY